MGDCLTIESETNQYIGGIGLIQVCIQSGTWKVIAIGHYKCMLLFTFQSMFISLSPLQITELYIQFILPHITTTRSFMISISNLALWWGAYNSITVFTQVYCKRRLKGCLECKLMFLFCVEIVHINLSFGHTAIFRTI